MSATNLHPANAVAARQEPPPESPGYIWRRRSIVFSFWAIAICLGLPLWYRTTTVYRTALPLERMSAWADGKVCNPVFPLRINLDASSLRPAEAENLLRVTQHALDDLNEFPTHHLRLALVNDTQGTAHLNNGLEKQSAQALHAFGHAKEEPVSLNIRLRASDGQSVPTARIRPNSLELEIVHSPQLIPTSSTSPSALGDFIAGQVYGVFDEERNLLQQFMSLGIPSGTVRTSNQNTSTSMSKRATRMAKYAPVYHLTFSLFTPTAFPSTWEIEAAIQNSLLPLLASFNTISNFTIDTQVQPYALFSPSIRPTYSEPRQVWMIRQEELGGFINAAEWPLNPSIGEGPTLNFVLYVAPPTQSPMIVEGSSTNSWIIPQWGGVVIVSPPTNPADGGRSYQSTLGSSDLQPAIEIFASQLLSLLGLPATPAASLPLRLSTLVRIRAAGLLLSASSTLGSLARLVATLPSISIPDSVAASVALTLSHLNHACKNLQNGDFETALDNARVAEREAQKAFFERSMVGQVYFPDEHKVAVYLPLLGPMAVPLVMSAVKEIRPFLRGSILRRAG